MNTLHMSNSHQTNHPWALRLAPRQAATLAAEAAERWLLVEEGQVWVTRHNGQAQAEDIWLAQGQSLRLPAGSTWVLEGWPAASLSLAQPARLLA